jgi:SOS-response transcriptional repressor LexA
VNLTTKQRDLLIYVCAYLCEHGRQPTYRECMERFGIRSTNGVACHFVALKRKGYIGAECHPHGLRLLRWPDGSPSVDCARLSMRPLSPWGSRPRLRRYRSTRGIDPVSDVRLILGTASTCCRRSAALMPVVTTRRMGSLTITRGQTLSRTSISPRR